MAISENAISDASDIDPAELDDNTAKTHWRVTVSLESDSNPVLTWRGQFHGGSPAGIASKAIRLARREFPKKQARSWAICLEKL